MVRRFEGEIPDYTSPPPPHTQHGTCKSREAKA
jgi:hypothetical protein